MVHTHSSILKPPFFHLEYGKNFKNSILLFFSFTEKFYVTTKFFVYFLYGRERTRRIGSGRIQLEKDHNSRYDNRDERFERNENSRAEGFRSSVHDRVSFREIGLADIYFPCNRKVVLIVGNWYSGRSYCILFKNVFGDWEGKFFHIVFFCVWIFTRNFFQYRWKKRKVNKSDKILWISKS